MVYSSTRRFVEDAIGDQMVMQARIVAHLVAIAEQKRPEGMTPEEINRHLKDLARFAKDQKNYDYEFWITDSAGKVVMGTEGVEFTFKADQPQAGVFLRLLDGGRRPHGRRGPGEPQARDRQPRLQVRGRLGRRQAAHRPGRLQDRLLARRARHRRTTLLAAGVAALLLATGGLGYFTLRRMVTVPLDQLIRAAQAVEDEEYEMGTLKEVRARGDELGRLASVFEDMVGKLATRYECWSTSCARSSSRSTATAS